MRRPHPHSGLRRLRLRTLVVSVTGEGRTQPLCTPQPPARPGAQARWHVQGGPLAADGRVVPSRPAPPTALTTDLARGPRLLSWPQDQPLSQARRLATLACRAVGPLGGVAWASS